MFQSPNPYVIISARKDLSPEFYENMLLDKLFRTTRYDVSVEGMGLKTVDAVDLVCRLAKKLEGKFLLRYGTIRTGQKTMEDCREKSTISIPCRILSSELQDYFKVRNLNSYPWDENQACLNPDSKRAILYLLQLTCSGGHGTLIGYDENIINIIQSFNSVISRTRNFMHEKLKIEIGYNLDEETPSPAIKIDMDMKKP